MKRILTLILSLAAMVTATQAGPVSLSGGDNQGEGREMVRVWENVLPGVDMTVTAFRNDGGFIQTATNQYDGEPLGLGVCSVENSCWGEEYELENYMGGADLAVFSFSAPVDIVSATISQFAFVDDRGQWGDSDVIWSTSGDPDAAPGSVVFVSDNGDPMTPWDTRQINIGALGVRSLFLGVPQFGGIDQLTDHISLLSIYLERSQLPPLTSAPEPGSMALLGLGLIGLGFFGRRVRSSRDLS